MKSKWIFFILFIVIISISFQSKDISFDDYDMMNSLTVMSKEELSNLGYSKDQINIIKDFHKNYQNFVFMQNLLLESRINELGYDNRQIVNNSTTNSNNKKSYNLRDDSFVIDTTICDYNFDNDLKRNTSRIYITMNWIGSINSNNESIELTFQNFTTNNQYALLNYKNTQNSNVTKNLMYQFDPNGYVNNMNIEIDPQKKLDNRQFELSSGVFILDLKSVYKDVKTPLTFEIKHFKKNILGKKILVSSKKIELTE